MLRNFVQRPCALNRSVVGCRRILFLGQTSPIQERHGLATTKASLTVSDRHLLTTFQVVFTLLGSTAKFRLRAKVRLAPNGRLLPLLFLLVGDALPLSLLLLPLLLGGLSPLLLLIPLPGNSSLILSLLSIGGLLSCCLISPRLLLLCLSLLSNLVLSYLAVGCLALVLLTLAIEPHLFLLLSDLLPFLLGLFVGPFPVGLFLALRLNQVLS